MHGWQHWLKHAPAQVAAPQIQSPKHLIGRAIIHRDQVHGDVQYDRLSVELLNTHALQRLGRVLQLGYSHLVFRGGTHTRLSHVLGAAYLAGSIVDVLRANYRQKRAAQPRHVAAPIEFLPAPRHKIESDRWDVLRHIATWAALLHDLGHIPLGHTLEDEFEGIFEKHDDFASPRSNYLWGKDGEIFLILTNSALYPESFDACGIQPIDVWHAVMLVCFYKDVRPDADGRFSDFQTFLEYRLTVVSSEIAKFKRQSRGGNKRETGEQLETLDHEKTFISHLLEAVRNPASLFRPFMTDIVANTICADYLDYVRRDPLNVGLDVLRDDRILAHFYVSTEPKSQAYRMALALLDRHGKPRLDVCTGVVEQVRQRYRFAELIYYHKTKVSASAMFAKAMYLIGKPKEIADEQFPLFDADVSLDAVARILVAGSESFAAFKAACLPSALMHPEIGDDSLHLYMMQKALDNIESQLNKNGAALRGHKAIAEKATRSARVEAQLRGISLLQGIVRRRLYKASVSINAAQFGKLTRGASPDTVVEERLVRMLHLLRDDKASRNLRARIEGEMADAAGWPRDTILLYVPPRKSQAKGIETFAFDRDGVVRLNEHPAVSEKVNELSRDYQKLWRLLVLTHPGYQGRSVELSEAMDVLVRSLWSDFGDGGLDVDLHDEARVSMIREVARFPYIRKDHREAAIYLKDLLSHSANENQLMDWEFFERAPILTTTSEATLTSLEYAERAFLLHRLVGDQGANAKAEERAISKVRQAFSAPNHRFAGVQSRATAPTNSRYRARRAAELERVATDISHK
jgi:HD superfamily phosphohydrolase